MARRAYAELVQQLNHQSVAKHFDAYADVPWDDPAYAIDRHDPRWELGDDHVLGATRWYKTLPQPVRAQLGLHGIVSQMKLGVEFEAVLSRGLLEFATSLPNGSPEFRYAYHEMIEEGQHSLMFQEFVNRSGLDAQGMGGFEAFFARRVPGFGRTFPQLFFLFVLGGEAPIDHAQREELRKRDGLHPLLRRVMRIHVTEEARHLCFAKNFLLQSVPKLGAFRRFQLKVRTPIIFSAMARQMLEPPRALVREYEIPKSVVREAYTDNPVHRQRVMDSLASVRELAAQLDLIVPSYWRALGLLPDAENVADDYADESSVRRRPVIDTVGAPVIEARARAVPGVVRACPRAWVQPMSA